MAVFVPTPKLPKVVMPSGLRDQITFDQKALYEARRDSGLSVDDSGGYTTRFLTGFCADNPAYFGLYTHNKRRVGDIFFGAHIVHALRHLPSKPTQAQTNAILSRELNDTVLHECGHDVHRKPDKRLLAIGHCLTNVSAIVPALMGAEMLYNVLGSQTNDHVAQIWEDRAISFAQRFQDYPVVTFQR